MQDRKKHKYIIIPILILGVLFLQIALTFIEAENFPVLYRLDAPVHDRLFRLRNHVTDRSVFSKLFTRQPISTDITLIGIDDYTTKKLGLYGRGAWITRKPYVEQIEYSQKFFKPAVMAYDIIFKEIKGETEVGKTTLSKEDLAKILVSLRKYNNGEISEIDVDTLSNITKLVSDQGNYNLALALSLFDFDEDSHTTTIAAYDFKLPDDSEHDVGIEWALKSIIGEDPDDLSEENGTEIPYLRDISIPMDFIHDLPDDYQFSRYATLPTNILLDYVRLAYINVPRDEGGVVRRVPLIYGMEYEYTHPSTGEFHQKRFFVPSLSLLSCLYFWGIDLSQMNADEDFIQNSKPVIDVHWGKHIIIQRPSGEVVKIPIDEKGNLFLDFVSTIHGFNSVHFADVGFSAFYEQIKRFLYQKIAIIGVTSTGADDVGACPVDDNTPFVHIHMIAMSNILTQTFIQVLDKTHHVLILLILTLFLAPAAVVLRPLRYSYYTLFSLAAYGSIVCYYTLSHQYLLPVAGPILFIVLTYFTVLVYYYVAEEKEKKRIRGMFATMVSHDVLQYLEDNPESFSLEGRRADATMFFSDVAGFTTISERLTPEKLVELLNLYLSPMTEIIMDSDGFVDKYEGDAIMAEWGVPFPMEGHASAACRAALAQQKKLSELRDGFKEHFDVDLTVRMGLNSGLVSAGNMGSDKHFSFTVMGDAVNQAARFEPANKDYGTDIMIGETTYELAKNDIEARLLDKIVVKGKSVPIKVFELIAEKGEISEEKAKVLQLYNEGLELYWERKWDESVSRFEEALSIIEDDGPALAMKSRVENYKKHPPPESWQGEYLRASKD